MHDRSVEHNLLFSAQGGSLSLDALSALGDTLAAPEPKPEPPKVRPGDTVSVGTLTGTEFTAFDGRNLSAVGSTM